VKARVGVLLGPTGAGKTALALRLDPERHEVVSCDSRQVYAGMEIGTAAPSAEECARMPHHLVAFLSPAERMDAARYVELAVERIEQILAAGKQPWLVGGAGFYYRALKTGLFSIEVPDELRAELQALAPGERRERLRRIDPRALIDPDKGEEAGGGRIHPNDEYRIGRALEISIASGRAWSEHWREGALRVQAPEAWRYDFRGLRLEPDRARLWSDLEKRARAMAYGGMPEEAARVFAEYGDCPALQVLGYELALAAARGELEREELAGRLSIQHRQYAKRQATWLRRETELLPRDPAGLRGSPLDEAPGMR